jgi:gamma-glutamylcyclotransferase (GGCT)/AIG2-like uncharacterized protein YtfP
MTLYFAYGSNMSRALMRSRCPTAYVVGEALLPNWRFLVTRDGYASLARRAGARVHGVLWRLAPRDLAALNAYERVDAGLYRRHMLALRVDGRQRAALVYLGRSAAPGRPRPGYLATLVDAAQEWRFPPDYVDEIRRWSPSRWTGAWAPESGALAKVSQRGSDG